jgi:hypothetical protein
MIMCGLLYGWNIVCIAYMWLIDQMCLGKTPRGEYLDFTQKIRSCFEK